MAESALLVIARPLIGTASTGISKNEVTIAIGDATNRAMRRMKLGKTDAMTPHGTVGARG
ncbi:hypothetical protein HQO42_13730 [Rhodococcus fascians]|nr:hypothetical protein [Rhodococcus fascians]MBY4239552.1 hypothetical protein [Rhodococcus fascians]MBY4253716.1 hypothetical protein [Rhodococcus fascians]MBY4271141.1 hypothetical protein [Rhodococcus fascians]